MSRELGLFRGLRQCGCKGIANGKWGKIADLYASYVSDTTLDRHMRL